MSDPQEAIWQALAKIMDPEIPVVSLVEMGIIRDVEADGGAARVTITPTFAGCPALAVMQREIRDALHNLGYTQTEVPVRLAPPWSTDWIQPEARRKLQQFGIAPPPMHHGNVALVLLEPVECPYCGSPDTSLQNSFGSTPCRMIFTCRACRQPFERIKPL